MLNSDDRARYKRLLSYIRPHWKVVLLLFAATIVYGLTEPLVPMVMKPLIDGEDYEYRRSNTQSDPCAATS